VKIGARFVALILSWVPLLLLAACWQICAYLVGPSRCPDIGQSLVVLCDSFFHEPIIEAQGGGSNGLSTHVVATLVGFSGGFTSGIIIGFALALTMSQFRALSHLLEPALEFLRAIPPLLVVPFAILLCRSNDTLEWFTVAIYSAFSICVYTLTAVRNIVPSYLQLAELLGAGRLRRVFDVQIPAIMPELVGAFRVTAALSLGIAVVVEYLAAPAGIGRVMKFAMSYSRIDLIVVSVIWVVIIAIGVDRAISTIFGMSLGWARRQELTTPIAR
jgi:ABC-type nitrate/sulfonate/bicarbonate transport system permease component